MQPFEIRRATAADADGILTCLAAAFEPYRSQYTPGALADTVLNSETVQIRLRKMWVLVAVSVNRIVGTLAFAASGPEGHLRGMAVLPDWQGTGVASALLRTAEAELLKSGCKFVTLDTTEPLVRAVRFYERNGYRSSGGISDFFGMRLYQYSKPLPDLR